MKFSILVLTHKRPEKFNRLINSIVSQTYTNYEVIINNDSDDVDIDGMDDRFTLHYNKFDNLFGIYNFLYMQATGDYVWVIEDDDYIPDATTLQNVYDKMVDNVDIVIGGHYILPNIELVTYTAGIFSPNNFKYNVDNFQFSDMIFKRDLIPDFVFLPDQDLMDNDHNIFLRLLECSNIVQSLGDIIYVLTYSTDNLTWVSTGDGFFNNRVLE